MGSHPTSIGKYRVDGVIGEGGMGAVYRAFDPILEVPVAIKVIKGEADVKRFYTEARSTAAIRQCPNIVTVYDFGEQDGNPYLVMEYLEGISLDKIIKNRMPLSLSEKLRIIMDVLNGLSYAHERSIIHRDIKPANVIVQQDGQAKIVDFGIARLGDSSQTRTNTIMGTLEYMAPEAFDGRKLDATADIWATGCMLFQLLTGISPFKHENEADVAPVMRRIMHEPPPPIEEYIQEHQTEFKNILAKGLAKNREDRYASAKEFSLDVMQVQEQLREEDAARYFKEGEEAARAEEWERARQLFDAAVKSDPQNTTARRWLHKITEKLRVEQRKLQVARLTEEANVLRQAKRYDEALPLLDEAIHLDNTNENLIALRAAVENEKKQLARMASLRGDASNALQRGQLKAAADLVQQALSISPQDTQALTLDNLIRKKIEDQERQDQFKKLLEQGRKQISSGDLAAAAKTIEAASQLDSNSAELGVLTAQLSDARHRADRESALKQLNREIDAAFKAEDYKTALAKVMEGLEEFPGDKSLLDMKGIAEGQVAETDKKSFLNEKVKAINALLQDEKFDEARTMLEHALANYPGEATLEALRSRLEEKSAQADQKTKVFTRAQLDAQRKRETPSRPQPSGGGRQAPATADDATRVYTPAAAAQGAQVKTAAAAARDTRAAGAATAPAIEPVSAPAIEKPKPQPVPAHDGTIRFPAAKHVPPPPPKSKLPLYGGVAAVVLVIVGVVVYLMMPGAKTLVSFKVDPAGAQVEVAGQRCNAPCDLKLARGSASAKVSMDGYEAKQSDITVGATPQTVELALNKTAPTKPAGATPAPEVTGTLAVKANLDKFDVLVDGVQKGKSKGTSVNLTLPVGKYKIEVQKPNYEAESQDVEIAKDAPQRLEFTLKASANAQTYLSINAKRGARISVDGRFVGEAAADGFAYKVTPGNHAVHVELPGYRAFDGSVSANAGETKQVAVNLAAAPATIAAFSANPPSVQQGNAAEINWQADGTEVTIEPGIGKVSVTGSRQVNPNSTTTYTLTAKNADGQTVQRQLTLNVTAPPPKAPSISQFESGSDSIQSGQTTKLIWETQNANDVSIEPGIGALTARGSRSVKPDKTTTYTLVAKGPGGSTQQSVTITVEAAAPATATPPPVVTTTAAVNPEVKAVLDLKDRYIDAYDSMSVDAERSVWPSIPAERAKVDAETFRKMRAMRLRLDCGNPAISGDTASLSCTQTLQRTTSSGKLESVPPVKLVFGMKKANGGWVIDSMRGQQ